MKSTKRKSSCSKENACPGETPENSDFAKDEELLNKAYADMEKNFPTVNALAHERILDSFACAIAAVFEALEGLPGFGKLAVVSEVERVLKDQFENEMFNHLKKRESARRERQRA